MVRERGRWERDGYDEEEGGGRLRKKRKGRAEGRRKREGGVRMIFPYTNTYTHVHFLTKTLNVSMRIQKLNNRVTKTKILQDLTIHI